MKKLFSLLVLISIAKIFLGQEYIRHKEDDTLTKILNDTSINSNAPNKPIFKLHKFTLEFDGGFAIPLNPNTTIEFPPFWWLNSGYHGEISLFYHVRTFWGLLFSLGLDVNSCNEYAIPDFYFYNATVDISGPYKSFEYFGGLFLSIRLSKYFTIPITLTGGALKLVSPSIVNIIPFNGGFIKQDYSVSPYDYYGFHCSMGLELKLSNRIGIEAKMVLTQTFVPNPNNYPAHTYYFGMIEPSIGINYNL